MNHELSDDPAPWAFAYQAHPIQAPLLDRAHLPLGVSIQMGLAVRVASLYLVIDHDSHTAELDAHNSESSQSSSLNKLERS